MTFYIVQPSGGCCDCGDQEAWILPVASACRSHCPATDAYSAEQTPKATQRTLGFGSAPPFPQDSSTMHARYAELLTRRDATRQNGRSFKYATHCRPLKRRTYSLCWSGMTIDTRSMKSFVTVRTAASAIQVVPWKRRLTLRTVLTNKGVD